jgi:hypothetical protein
MDDALDIMVIDGEPRQVINFHKVALQIQALTDQVQGSPAQIQDIRQTLPSTFERLFWVIETLQERVEVLEETLARTRKDLKRA